MARWLDVAKQKGALQAAEWLLRLNADQTRPVEVFDIIEKNGIWLLFDALDGALGMFKREGSVAGILINNRRPRAVQRLTAAHEFGHFVLGHDGSVDGQSQIDGFSNVRQEVEAQAFAMDFLMPLQLVEATRDHLSLPSDSSKLQPHQIYQLATSMGVSYTACVIQLRAMEMVTLSESKRLLQYTPKKAKRILSGGIGPVDPWADVWPIEEVDSGRQLQIQVRDEIRLKLSELPSTGYRWDFEPQSLDTFSVVGDEFEGLREPVVGSGGHRFFSIRVDAPGKHELELTLRRSWNPRSVLRDFHVTVIASENLFGGERIGPRGNIQKLLLEGVAD